MRSFLLALLGVVLLPMAGCDSGGSGDDLDLSSFTLAVGDDDDVTHSPALFGTATNDEGQEGFGLLLGASDADFDNAQPFVAFAGVETELPGTGTYSLFDGTDDANAELPEGEVVAVYFVPPATEDGDLFVYISESGSLRVTDSDEDEMSGSYTIHARRFVLSLDEEGFVFVDTGIEKDLSGEYRARRDDSAFGGEPALGLLGTPAVAQ